MQLARVVISSQISSIVALMSASTLFAVHLSQRLYCSTRMLWDLISWPTRFCISICVESCSVSVPRAMVCVKNLRRGSLQRGFQDLLVSHRVPNYILSLSHRTIFVIVIRTRFLKAPVRSSRLDLRDLPHVSAI
ncbi:hypothetical protein B0J17DRAFT_220614 [Rhizoctonia solani]|nr:hypothetical protein B0J17DRAFT_220614 [Rhizoctonia solani]